MEFLAEFIDELKKTMNPAADALDLVTLGNRLPDLRTGDDTSKRRRHDDEFKHMVSTVNTTGRAHNGAQVLRVLEGANHCSSAVDWEVGFTKEYWASHLSWRLTGVVSMCEDASRNGKPRLDVLNSLLWDADTDLGGTGPPIVFRRGQPEFKNIYVDFTFFLF
jgi:hypothetical protein